MHQQLWILCSDVMHLHNVRPYNQLQEAITLLPHRSCRYQSVFVETTKNQCSTPLKMAHNLIHAVVVRTLMCLPIYKRNFFVFHFQNNYVDVCESNIDSTFATTMTEKVKFARSGYFLIFRFRSHKHELYAALKVVYEL